MTRQTCSLILAAHGSDDSPKSNAPLFALAEKIQHQSHFSVVTPAFLQGQPTMDQVLQKLPTGNVVVVPMMTSEGYYFRQLPERFARNESFHQFEVQFTKPLGVHERLPLLVAERVSNLLTEFEFSPPETTVVVVGHGTRRNKQSCVATVQLTKQVREFLAPELVVKFGFIDQNPGLEKVAADIVTPNTLVMPFLISHGPHSRIDVPEAFGLPVDQADWPLVRQQMVGRCVCDQPIGTLPGVADLCIDLANRTIGLNESLESGLSS